MSLLIVVCLVTNHFSGIFTGISYEIVIVCASGHLFVIFLRIRLQRKAFRFSSLRELNNWCVIRH